MATTTPSRGRLRRLADVQAEGARVLSIFIDLDPSEFAAPPARQSQITSLLDEAGKRVDAAGAKLGHDELAALRADVERLREALDPVGLAEGGARGLAAFACGPADLLEIVRLPYPVESRVVIADKPDITPLAAAGEPERWCVALVSSRSGRVFVGDEHGLEELGDVRDDTHGRHQQGGWSQRRYEDTVDEEIKTHLDRVASELLVLLRRRPFDRLVVGGPEPLDSEFESRLHPYLRERLSGRVRTDVDHPSAAEILTAAAPVFEAARRDREREAIERLRAGLGRDDGRAVAGLQDVTDALEQRRVEVLLLEPPGAHGWSDAVTGAIELTVAQSAEVLVLRDAPDLGPHGGIAALLRF